MMRSSICFIQALNLCVVMIKFQEDIPAGISSFCLYSPTEKVHRFPDFPMQHIYAIEFKRFRLLNGT